MRRTTTKNLRSSPGVKIEGRFAGLERTPQSPRVKSGGRVGDPGRMQQSPGRAQSSWFGGESPRMNSRSGGGRSPYMERFGTDRPASKAEKRRLAYGNGGSPHFKRMQAIGKQTTLIDRQLEVVLKTLNRNVKLEGLHRISGSDTAISGALKSFESGKVFRLDGGHEASGLLRKLFEQGVYDGDKGDTLIPGYMQYDLLTLYQKKVEEKNLAAEEKQQFLKELAGWLLRELPAANRRAFLKILAHLKLVAQHHESNKMTAANLAIVFGPRLCAAPTAARPGVLLNYASVFADLMRILIEQDFKIEV